MRRWTWLVGLVVACGKGDEDTETPAVDYRSNPLAGDIVVDSVRINQGSERVLYLGPGVIGGGDRPPPIVADRDAMVKVELSGLDEDEVVERDVAVVLGLTTASGTVDLTQIAHVAPAESVFSDRPSVKFDVPGDVVTTDLQLTVDLYEVGPTSPGTYLDEVSWASADAGPLDVRVSDRIELHVIPVHLQADERMPDTSAERLIEIERQVTAMYPASEVDVILEPVLNWPNDVTPFTGWEQLLAKISEMRLAAPVPSTAYFYGTFVGTDTVDEWCAGGCILGLSLLPPSAGDDWGKASIGVGYTESTVMVETLVHEVGHAHGRMHAPCGDVAGPDPQFPYGGAPIGVNGYDLTSKTELSATETFDMMGYCTPIWVSDYTFSALYDRIVGAGAIARSARAPAEWRLVRVAEDGTTEEGGIVTHRGPPRGELRWFDETDERGRAIRQVQGAFVPFDHLPGGVALLPPDVGPSLRLR